MTLKCTARHPASGAPNRAYATGPVRWESERDDG